MFVVTSGGRLRSASITLNLSGPAMGKLKWVSTLPFAYFVLPFVQSQPV